MADIFDPLSIPTSFNSAASVTKLFDPLNESPKMLQPRDSNPKRHSACDECRQRKLKCSGQLSGCDRCIKQKIECHYSEQKQMGRPRKRQKTDDEPTSQSAAPSFTSQPPPVSEYPGLPEFADLAPPEPETEPPIDPSLAAIDQEHTQFTNVCTGPIAQSIRDLGGPQIYSQQLSHFGDLQTDGTSGVTANASYPLDITQWPDYSNFELPLPMRDDSIGSNLSYSTSTHSAPTDTTGSSYDPDANPAALHALPAAPACPCLANLYLTLSTLSTLTSFPVSSHTMETLLAAHKTAHSVIYCHVCPRTFQAGSQNLMLGCTLLNVLADHWHRVRRTSSEDIKRGFSSSKDAAGNTAFMTTREGQSWRQFLSDLIRAYVFGDKPIPTPPSSFSPQTPLHNGTTINGNVDTNANSNNNDQHQNMVPSQYALISLIEALARRQRQWHDMDEPTDEFPDRCSEGYAHLYAHLHHPNSDDKTHNRGSSSKKSKTREVGYCKIHGHHNLGHKDKNNASPPNGARTADTDVENTNPQASSETNGSNRTDHDRNEKSSTDADADDEDNDESARKAYGDHTLCLMLVKHSMDIVKNLDHQHS